MDIRNCNIKYKCPKKWDYLENTFNSNVRFCDQCKQNVYYCKGKDELLIAMKNDWCVAICVDSIEEVNLADMSLLEAPYHHATEVIMGDIDWADFKDDEKFK